MANVTIVPLTTQVQNVSTIGGGQAQGAASASLQPGSIVSGIITGRDGSGNFLLRTSQGTLSLQSNTPLTYNSDVVVQIGTSGNNTTARIISVNGEPFSSYAAAEPETSDSLTQSFGTQAAATDDTLPQTSAIRATIISAPTAEQAISNTQAGNNNAQPVSGTPVLIRVTSAPQTTSQQANVSTPPQPVTSQSNQAGSASVQAQAEAQQLSEDATPANVAKLVAPQPATVQQNNPAPAAANNTPQTAEEELANASAAPQEDGFSTQPSPANVLYATYAKQAVVNATQQPTTPIAQNTASTPAADSTANEPANTSSTPSSPSTPAAPANAAATAQTSAPSTNTLQGRVLATNSDASTVTLQTPVGAVTVKTDAPAQQAAALLPTGTTVSIELPAGSPLASLITQASLATSSLLLSADAAPLNELASSWQTLNDIVKLVAANDPSAASSALAKLPQLGADFIPATLSFIGALAEGDAKKLLGDDTIDTLRQNGRLDLLQKFTDEMSALNNAYSAPPQRQTPGWQQLFLPFVYQEEIQQARLFVKRDPPKKDSKDKKATHDTRFVIEVDLSEMGPLQMDGLIRSKQQSTAFDLIVRSRSAFSAEDKMEINGIYNSAAELTGFRGSIAFQVTAHFPVKPLDEMLANAPHGITV